MSRLRNVMNRPTFSTPLKHMNRISPRFFTAEIIEELIEIVIVASDQRRRMAWLIETGARRLEQAIPVWRAANAKLAQLIPPELTRALVDATATLTLPKNNK
jgi:hypothetical protein